MYATKETDPMLHPFMGKEEKEMETPVMRFTQSTSRCNDAWAAVLFLGHVIAITILALYKGVPTVLEKNHLYKSQDNSKQLISLSLGIMGLTVAISGFWLQFLMSHAESLIRVSLWLNVCLTVFFAIATFAVKPFASLLLLLFALVNVCYIYAVRNRIGFATANLKCACAAVQKCSGLFSVALLLAIQQLIWLIVWALSFIAVHELFRESDPNCVEFYNVSEGSERICGGSAGGVTLFFMLISLYWGQQVIQNILTCTAAGTVATWWYHANMASATPGALYRSLTTSFGSICLGSLFVAVLQAMQTMARILREKAQEEENTALACVACIAECFLSCLESIMEYFNMWAYVYVGIYGSDFRTSGKAVMDLFRNRGWTAVINDDLTSSALTFSAIGVGCATAALGMIAVFFAPSSWFTVVSSKQTGYGIIAAIGFLSGFSVSMILSNVLITALHTVFVCFAEDPIALNRNHPQRYKDLVEGWRQFHSEELSSIYRSSV